MLEQEEEKQSKTLFSNVTRLGVIVALVAVFSFVGGLSVGANGQNMLSGVPFVGNDLNSAPDTSANLSDFWKAWNVLSARFVQTNASSTLPETKEKIWGAISGMVASFGDPYTVFMPPEDAKAFAEDISGSFGGVGMEIGMKNKILTVISPLKGTPAEKAGILSGDQVITIDDTSTEGLSTEEAVRLIRGEKGTVVKLRIVRDGEVKEISITRDIIQVPTIEATLDKKTDVFTISLYSFTANSGALFSKALAAFRTTGSHKLIVDLRGNPGGYLSAAVSVASHFLPEGDVIVTEDYNGNRENIIHRSKGMGGVPQGTRVVVLINQGSASASEIVAGALKDTKTATVIGETSFGKGSVQELVDVGGGSLKITVARWLTPNGTSISHKGLVPNIEVKRTQEDVVAEKDPQKERAIQFLTTGK